VLCSTKKNIQRIGKCYLLEARKKVANKKRGRRKEGVLDLWNGYLFIYMYRNSYLTLIQITLFFIHSFYKN